MTFKEKTAAANNGLSNYLMTSTKAILHTNTCEFNSFLSLQIGGETR